MASLFIDGAWVAGASGTTASVVNPADGTVVRAVDVADPADVERAVAAARRSFEDGAWAGTPAGGRELGLEGLDEYREAKHIFENTAPAATGWFGGAA